MGVDRLGLSCYGSGQIWTQLLWEWTDLDLVAMGVDRLGLSCYGSGQTWTQLLWEWTDLNFTVGQCHVSYENSDCYIPIGYNYTVLCDAKVCYMTVPDGELEPLVRLSELRYQTQTGYSSEVYGFA